MLKTKKIILKCLAIIVLITVLFSFSSCYNGAMYLISHLGGSSNSESDEASNSTSNSTGSTDSDDPLSGMDLTSSITKSDAEASEYGSAGTDVFEISEVVRKVQDSVVQIYTAGGAGSGVIISDEPGWVLTCNHVIDGQTAYTVELSDGTRYDATLRGADEDTDLAVLQITPEEGETLTDVPLGKSANLVAGEKVIVIGNPLGTLGGTVTQGIISATERQISFSNSDGSTTVMTLIQTDAAINSGNSGGAMFNLKGELIGIVNAKYSSTGVEGLGFAIPIDEAYDVALELINYRYVRGLPDDGLTLYTQSNFSFYSGSYNTYLFATASKFNSALTNKQILSVNGISVSSAAEYKNAIAGCKVGDTIEIKYVKSSRSGETATTTITLQEKVPDYITSSN